MRKREYRYINVWSEDSDIDIIFGSYSPRLEIDIEIAKELVKNRIEFSDGVPAYALIDFSNVKSVTKEARDYMNDPEGGLKGVLGGAFLSNNVVATLFINLYLKINKPIVPAKFFTNKKDALEWLRTIRSKKSIL
ncbi:MAG: hypothetical protein ACKVOQ_10105 [Cyclobacteriaceae bacterium]